jgi:hypothetical protein
MERIELLGKLARLRAQTRIVDVIILIDVLNVMLGNKRKVGRPCIGDRPMTSTERSRRRRAERAKEPK